MTRLRQLKLQVFLKENLAEALEAKFVPPSRVAVRVGLTFRAAGAHLGLDPGLLQRWTDPEQGAPGGKRLVMVVKFIERRLGVKAPA